MKQFNGKDVAVLWSGGFDSSFLALELAKAGANVVCVTNTGSSLEKLGDIINRRRVKPLLEYFNVRFDTCNVTVQVEEGKYGNYSRLLRDTVKAIKEKYPGHRIASGVLSSDMCCNEALEVFKPYDVYTPFVDYTYSQYSAMKSQVMTEHSELSNLSVCDNGHFLWHPKHVSCSAGKDRTKWCFKCHEQGDDYVKDVYRKHLTVDDFNYLIPKDEYDNPNVVIGSLFGHLVVKARPKSGDVAFAARVDTWEDIEALSSDLHVDISVMERKGRKEPSERPLKKQIVSIYLSELRRLTSSDLRQPLKYNAEFACELIRLFVEYNYLPTGYEWDMHSLKILWRNE